MNHVFEETVKLLLFSDLQSRSLLDRPVEVTCESPPSLRGRPVWNVTVCATPPPPGPSVTQTIQPKPTDIRPPSSGTCSSSLGVSALIFEILHSCRQD